MTDHLVFKKFLARSFFGHLVSNKILAGSFSNSNMHADHVDFNAFLASTFLNVSMHVSHLFFLVLNGFRSCRHGYLFTRYPKKSNQLKVLCKKAVLKRFMDV